MQKSRGSVAKRRRNARQKAMQALYQWDFDTEAQSITHIVDQFCDMQNMDKVDVEYFRELFYYAAKNLSTIDELIEPYLDRPMERLDPVEKSVLRIACAELTSRLDTPYKVVVNEAVEVCKLFGAEEGHKFVNGIVDKLAANIRQIEYNKENARRGQDKKEPDTKGQDTKGQDTKGQDTKSQDTNGPETSANVSDAASGTDSD